MFSGNNINNAITVLGLLNLLALPYIIFSIYYQWRVAKQWCVLCLGVQALLLLGGVNIFINNFLSGFAQLPASFLVNAAFIYLLPVLLWFVAKPSILHLQEAKNTKREYLRIKFNQEIFETLLKKQKAISAPVDGLGIDLGNPGASNTLIKVCNPYCGPCAQVHPIIDEILHSTPNVKVKVIFNATTNERDYRKEPVKHLLSIAAEGNKLKIEQSLDDWYLPEKKDYSLFAAKYPLNGKLLKQDHKIEAMDNWCQVMKISHTPTIFLNGYEIPNAYSVVDLKYFLSE
jgi:thiol-disulfide isomerase/thioredoxin